MQCAQHFCTNKFVEDFQRQIKINVTSIAYFTLNKYHGYYYDYHNYYDYDDDNDDDDDDCYYYQQQQLQQRRRQQQYTHYHTRRYLCNFFSKQC